MPDYPITLPADPGPLLAPLAASDLDVLAETLVAFANTDGGAIPLTPDVGDLDAVLLAVCEYCTPSLDMLRLEYCSDGNGAMIPVIRVPRSASVHALSDGRVLVRAGRSNRVLDGAGIRKLVSMRSNGDFDSEIVPRATPADLDPNLLAEFLVKRAEHLGQRLDDIDADLLTEIGAATREGYITVAGMLLFGRDPQHWLPYSSARLVRYVGKKTDNPVFEQTVTGPLSRLIDQLWSLIREQMKSGPEEEYPAQVVREALVNAVCHRDYRLRKYNFEVRMFSDRLEISNPGGLPGFLTINDIVDGRFSRNPCLAWSLYLWGYVEEPGFGVRRMVEIMEQAGYRPPQFEARPYKFTVRLYNARTPRPDAVNPASEARSGLNARQRKALEHVQKHGSITIREFRTLFPQMRPDVLQQDLTALVEAGRLRKIGSRTNAYYIIP